MGWVTEYTAQQMGVFGGLGVIIFVTIAYVIKFQTTFTSKLEKQGQHDEEAIKGLQAEVRSLQDVNGELRVAVIERDNKCARYERALIIRGIDPKTALEELE